VGFEAASILGTVISFSRERLRLKVWQHR
jgi:hypothetical protein